MTEFLVSSLRIRLLGLVLLAVIPALGLEIYDARDERQREKMAAQDNAQQLTRLIANDYKDLISDVRQLLITLARLPEVRRRDSAACNEMFRVLLQQHSYYANLGALTPEGTVFCSGVPLDAPINWANRAEFQRALQTQGVTAGDFQLDRTASKTSLTLAYSVSDDASPTKTQAVVFATLDMSWFSQIAAELRLSQGAALTVVDSRGSILARYPGPETWVGKSISDTPLGTTLLSQREGTANVPGEDGLSRLYAMRELDSVPEQNIFLSIGIPDAVAFAAADDALIRHLVGLTVVAILASAVAWVGSEVFILRQVNGLVRATKRLAAGEWGARTGLPHGPGELNHLASAFDGMADALEQRQSELRQAAEQIQRQLQRITALRNIDAAITSSFDLQLTLFVLLDQVVTQLHTDAADVLLLNSDTQTLEYAQGRGFRSRALQHTRLRLGEGYAGRVALERRIIHVPNLDEAKDGLARSPLLAHEGFFAYCAAPLIAKGQVKGVLEVFHRSPLDLNQEWLDFLEALAGQAAIAVDNATLFDDLQRSNADLALAYDSTLEGWSRALDLRDKETEGHTQRVTELTVNLARAMGISDAELVQVRRGALLHDIGKMGIPDSILLKPGPLTDEEWAIMRQHPVYAYEMLSPIAFLHPALDIPYCHHEKWDGTGYPRGLRDEQIPLVARIFAIVDVWDALRSDRPYRPAWAETKVCEYIRDQSGKHFDPQVTAVFLRTREDVVHQQS